MKDLEESVVLITSADPKKKDVIGTGFVIYREAQTSYVLTCAHVVEDVGGAENVLIYRQAARVIASSDVNNFDLAVLVVDHKRVSERPILRLDFSGGEGEGCKVKTAGYYLYSSEKKRSLASIEGVLGRQKFREDPDTGDRAKAWEIHINQGQLQKGYSGSPVVALSNDNVMGVVTNMGAEKNGEVGEIISIEALKIVCPELVQKIEDYWSRQHFTEELGDGVKLEMILIPQGNFLMGSADGDESARFLGKPQHQVEITQEFYLGKCPITQGQWQAVMRNNPSKFQNGNNYPVEQVSWDDCHKFLGKLNQQTGKQYRLPSEAEWEYACRAGTTTRYSFGDSNERLNEYAWFKSGFSFNPWLQKKKNSLFIDKLLLKNDSLFKSKFNELTHSPVATKKPNQFGLYDMYGNVFEWCEDDWEGNYKERRNQKPFVNSSDKKVLRGGAWNFELLWFCRSASRISGARDSRSDNIGFRVACSPPG